jgi:hypothetical protein
MDHNPPCPNPVSFSQPGCNLKPFGKDYNRHVQGLAIMPERTPAMPAFSDFPLRKAPGIFTIAELFSKKCFQPQNCQTAI